MYADISVQLVSLIYIVILSGVYFLKRKYNFLESKVYKFLLISTIGSLLLDIVSMYILSSQVYSVDINNLFSKIYFISLFIWIIAFIFYVILNNTTVKFNDFKTLIKKSTLCKGWVVLSVILFILLIILKIDYSVSPVGYYGDGVILIYALGIIGSLFLLFMLLFNSKKSSNDKNWSVLISIMILCIAFFIQMNTNGIFILGSVTALITMFLYLII